MSFGATVLHLLPSEHESRNIQLWPILEGGPEANDATGYNPGYGS